MLADGSFEFDVTELKAWQRYAIRARHESKSGFSDWGPEFVIRTDDGSEAVFDDSIIGDARVQIPSESWDPIDSEAISECAPHPRSYYVGGLNIGNQDFPGSGVRAKGGCGSSRSLDGKSAFKINLVLGRPGSGGLPSDSTIQWAQKDHTQQSGRRRELRARAHRLRLLSQVGRPRLTRGRNSGARKWRTLGAIPASRVYR